MPSATVVLVGRAEVLRAQLESKAAYPQTAGVDAERARLLRCGMALASFTAIEDFVKTRASELISSLNGSLIGFLQFPPLLREALTIGAIRHGAWRLDGERRKRLGDAVGYAQSIGVDVSSTRGVGLTAHPYAFSPNAYNVSWDTIKALGDALLVDNISRVCSKVGFFVSGTPFSPHDYITVAGETRNNVAHNPWTDVAYNDLVQLIEGITKCCCVVDMVLSFCVKRISSGEANSLGNKEIDDKPVVARVLDVLPAGCREIRPKTTRAFRRYTDLATARAAALPRCVAGREALVVRRGTVIESWVVPYL